SMANPVIQAGGGGGPGQVVRGEDWQISRIELESADALIWTRNRWIRVGASVGVQARSIFRRIDNSEPVVLVEDGVLEDHSRFDIVNSLDIGEAGAGAYIR